MSYQPADTLKNRTFIGLMIAQFLAGFNDQAIHASAMFYAINRAVLSEGTAVTMMPLLFYLPWALFVTVSAYFADRYSKTSTVIVWKISEIFVSLLLISGFILGTHFDWDIGVWMVLSCVFLMGTHSAFFSPAKYGAMPEVLQPHVLSKGNGVLESTTFLSNILGTVAGGFMTVIFFEQEWWIGVILLVLSIIGAGASFMMVKLPAMDPAKEFHILAPLINGFRTVRSSRPLMLSVFGIAFFLFMVAYMRPVLYMHGLTRVPPWKDDYTSMIVATVMLGIGLGCPLAGILSGGKIELGLVPIGCLGMMTAAFVAGTMLEHQIALIGCLIGIGFFSGFYMVPLYSLLQFRAPKKSKGEIIAVSNFFNVIGTTSASLLFGALVFMSQATGLSPKVDQSDLVKGEVESLETDKFRHVDAITIKVAERMRKGQWVEENPPAPQTFRAERVDVLLKVPDALKKGDEVIATEYTNRQGHHYVVRRHDQPLEPVKGKFTGEVFEQTEVVAGTVTEIVRDHHQDVVTGVTIKPAVGEPRSLDAELRYSILKLPGQGVEEKDKVIVSRYKINDVVFNTVRKSKDAMVTAYNNETLPRYLFFGAGGMTLLILTLLRWKLPDLMSRTLVWWRSLRTAKIRAVHLDKLPPSGPVVLVTNCDTPTAGLQLLSATDRNTVVVLPGTKDVRSGHVLQVAGDWSSVLPQARAVIQNGDLLAVSLAGAGSTTLLDAIDAAVPRIPVWCGTLSEKRVRVVFGEPTTSRSPDELRAEIDALAKLGQDATSPGMPAMAH